MPLRLLLAFLLLSAAEAKALPNLRLTVDPPADTVRPLRDEARLTLLPEGTAAAQGLVRWRLTVDLPPPGRIFSTDFPWIEGKGLLDIGFQTMGEAVQWRMVFPIRGRYEIKVKSEADGRVPVERAFPLEIREDPARLLYLGLSLAGVFLLGCLMGWAAPGSGVFLAVSLFSLSGVAAQERMDVGAARVGALTPVKLVLSDTEASRVNLSIVKLEDGKRLFHIEDVTVPGGATWNYHFFDGSPHQVRASIRKGTVLPPLTLERDVHVEALDPPGRTVALTYAIFLVPLLAGWLAGRWIKRLKTNPSLPAPPPS